LAHVNDNVKRSLDLLVLITEGNASCSTGINWWSLISAQIRDRRAI